MTRKFLANSALLLDSIEQIRKPLMNKLPVLLFLMFSVNSTVRSSIAKTPKKLTHSSASVQAYKLKIIRLLEKQKPLLDKLTEDIGSVESFRNLQNRTATASQNSKMSGMLDGMIAEASLKSLDKLKKFNLQFGAISSVPPSLKSANTLFKRYVFRNALYLSSLKSWLLHNKRSDYTNTLHYMHESAILFENAVEELYVNS